MNVAQQNALEQVAGRALSAGEVTAINPLLNPGDRNDVAIAAILSVGRKRLQSKLIGIGTIIAEMERAGLVGGEFLDALESLGATNRNVYWIMFNIQRGAFDIGDPASQVQVSGLKQTLSQYAAGLDNLLALGHVDDPIHFNIVSNALNIAEGRITL